MRSIPFIILFVKAYPFFSRQPYEPCSAPGSTRWTGSNGAKVTDSSDHAVERRLVNNLRVFRHSNVSLVADFDLGFVPSTGEFVCSGSPTRSPSGVKRKSQSPLAWALEALVT